MSDNNAAPPSNRGRNLAVGGSAGAALIALIMLFEGTVFHPYQDPIGVWTDCTGHTGRDVVHDIHHIISPTDCRQRLMSDLQRTADGIAPCIRVPVSDTTRAALISFSFNVGVQRFCSSGIARDLNAGRARQACAGLSRWVYAGGRQLPGLVRRRAAERQLCERGLQ